MARPRALIDTHNEINQVIESYRKEPLAWKKERLLAIKWLVESGKSYQEVASLLGRTESIVRVWTQAFSAGGIKALLTRGNGGGRKSKASKEIQEHIMNKLELGEFRTAKQFQKWIKEEHNVELGIKAVYYQLGKLGGRLKVARPSHTKKDQKAVVEFRTTLAKKIEDLKIPKNKKVR